MTNFEASLWPILIDGLLRVKLFSQVTFISTEHLVQNIETSVQRHVKVGRPRVDTLKKSKKLSRVSPSFF